jgi:transcription initiation factor TFIIIB Brf1 subunit/transcription initiation factor TFIIB
MCSECKKYSLRIDQANGEVVCNICGLVEQSNLIDMTKENRNFGAENSNVQMERTGDPMRVE